MAQPSLNPFQLDDPNAILAAKNAQITSDLAGQGRGTPLSQYGAGLGALFSRFVFGDPAIQKASAERNAAFEANSGLAPQGENESDIDYAIRSSHALYKAIAPIDSNKAGAIMDHIVSLQEARTQQANLQGIEAERKQKSDIERVTNGTFEFMSPDGLTTYGSVNRFNDDGSPNPNFSSQLAALKQAHPDGMPVTAQQAFANRAMIANQRAQIAMMVAQFKAAQEHNTGYTEGGLNEATAAALGSMTYANRLSKEQKTAVANNAAAAGLNMLTDGARAQAEIAGVRSAIQQAGRRTGNIAVLENSLWSTDPGRPGMGNLVLTALQGVDRTRMPFVNEGIAQLNFAGILKNGGPEAAYAGAIQSFINEYGRVVSGGGTITSDTARREAATLLSRAQNPDQVRSAIDQLARKETKALHDAGDYTLETMANKAKYPVLNRISQKLNLPVQSAFKNTEPNSEAAPNASPNGMVVDPLGIRKPK